jgi:hypothetical protein
LDIAGVAVVREFIRPAAVGDMPQTILDIMGWDAEFSKRAGVPTYPCLIDREHVVAELYGMVNVPTAVWIDETGCIVRLPEPAGMSDGFRAMNTTTFQMPAEAAADNKRRRRLYVDALRDWIAKGVASEHALSPDEVQRRMTGPTRSEALADAHFRVGAHLHRSGKPDAARPHLEEAVRLRPESWSFRRQAIVLSDPALTGQVAATPEYWQAVMSLGDGHYYPPIEMRGMPPPSRRARG